MAKKRSSVGLWIVIVLILGITITPMIIAAALIIGVLKALYHTE